MGFVITDGATGQTAEVNSDRELVVRAITEPQIEHASVHLGSAYSWDSTELNLTAGETFLFVQNKGSASLVCDRLIVNGSNVICFWDIGIGSATTTPAGTTITGVNLNETFSSQLADVTAISDETAVADAPIIMRVKTPIDNTIFVDLTGVVLGKDHYIQINQETTSDSGSVILIAHFAS